jgi:hypothetical protein
MSAILIAILDSNPKAWSEEFRRLAPTRSIRLWPDGVGNPADIAYACVWDPPQGLLAKFRNLKAILSLGAGVDNITADPSLPDIPIVRMVDPDLTMRMTEYVVLHVLIAHRRLRLYDAQQRERLWRDHDQPAANKVAVGIMGLGVLGRWPGSDSKLRAGVAPRRTLPALKHSMATASSMRFSLEQKFWCVCCRTRHRPKEFSIELYFTNSSVTVPSEEPFSSMPGGASCKSTPK